MAFCGSNLSACCQDAIASRNSPWNADNLIYTHVLNRGGKAVRSPLD